VILGLLDEAVTAGARLAPACDVVGLDVRTAQRWKKHGVGVDRRAGPATKPKNALSSGERAKVLALVNSPAFRDKSPKQIVPLLADRGEYVASESTMYRILRSEKQLRHRSRSSAPQKRHRPTPHTATGPNQVWSWDITYLKSAVRGSIYYLYMTLDVWSRKIVGFDVHATECATHAARMMAAACEAEGVGRGALVLHSDNGGPMKGTTMLAKLQELGVAASFSRPSVSNDNPFSESAFRTAKYRPEYPVRPFESVESARAWARNFVRWYNEEHLHSSIRFVTPSDRHEGHETSILAARQHVYAAACERRPDRWSQEPRNWKPVREVTLNPAPVAEVRPSA
jgi:transposase InsO family protein